MKLIQIVDSEGENVVLFKTEREDGMVAIENDFLSLVEKIKVMEEAHYLVDVDKEMEEIGLFRVFIDQIYSDDLGSLY